MRRLIGALALSALLAVPAVADAAPKGALKRISAKHYTLGVGTGKARNEALVRALGLPHASVGDVFNDANRFSEPFGNPFATRGIANLAGGFQWKNSGGKGGDGNDANWYPQGISGTADSSKGGTVEGHRGLLASWYGKDDRKGVGVRISFVGFVARQFPTYRHVLLVSPRKRKDGRAGFGPVNVHAGGIAWYGRFLYVVDTTGGFRVFDTSLMRRVNSQADKVGYVGNGRYAAAGYKYVLPQVFRYKRPKRSSLLFSYVSLDRAGKRPALLTGEYRAGKPGARLVRWPLSKDEGKPFLVASKHRVRASGAYSMRQTNVQGALRLGKRILLASSAGDSHNGCLASPGVGRRPVRRRWAVGGEDLYRDRTSGLVWSLTEHPGKRAVFSVPASDLAGKAKSTC